MDQPVINSSVRLITHRQINPCFFIYNALIMREGLESFLSVIASHTAFPEAAERHFAGGKVDDHIVDTAAAEATFGGDLLRWLCPGRKCKEPEDEPWSLLCGSLRQ